MFKIYNFYISSRKDLSDSALSPTLFAPVHRSLPSHCTTSSSQSVERSALLKPHIK